jgi:hypothetical protein
MYASSFLVLLASSTACLASVLVRARADEPPSRVIQARQAVVTPPPCVALSPPPSAEETEARFEIFGDAFIVEKNLTRAFEYISSNYKVGSPASVAVLKLEMRC